MRSSTDRLLATQRWRWERLHVRIRCGLHPTQPDLIRTHAGLGRWLVRQGQLDDTAAHLRMLRLLLDTAADEALPWFWRLVCLEHTATPAARLRTLLRGPHPDALHTLEARWQAIQHRLTSTPHEPR